MFIIKRHTIWNFRSDANWMTIQWSSINVTTFSYHVHWYMCMWSSICYLKAGTHGKACLHMEFFHIFYKLVEFEVKLRWNFKYRKDGFIENLLTIIKLNNVYVWPVRIRVKIHVHVDSPYPLVCCKRRQNGAVLRMRRGKPTSRVIAGVAR
jgi:hypothetical protein